ncbi:unnamed protein product [Gadus morhua 'NCC']
MSSAKYLQSCLTVGQFRSNLSVFSGLLVKIQPMTCTSHHPWGSVVHPLSGAQGARRTLLSLDTVATAATKPGSAPYKEQYPEDPLDGAKHNY